MGYTTEFDGRFNFDRPLDDDAYNLMVGLASTRRMKRKGLDPKYGTDGEFYYDICENTGGWRGQNRDESIVDYNKPPDSQPSLWLQWIPTEDKLYLEWDGGEKFYYYVEWLQYLIDKIISPHRYLLNGRVRWQGEDVKDGGYINIKDNVIKVECF